MKTLVKSILILTVAIGATAFTTTMKKQINIEESTIIWTGKKVLGSHTGTINLKEGYLEMDGEQLTGGMFVVDMTSINTTDLSGENKGKLEGHLRSDDFFGVDNYPTSTLVINSATKNADGYIVKGDITIKGKTESIEFDMDMGEDFAATKLKIDRTKFGIKYNSGSFFDSLGDAAISDNFELEVTLKF